MAEFDFGSLLDSQFKGIRKGYKFGSSFNERKTLARPEKKPVVAGSADNVTIKSAYETGEPVSGVIEKETKGGYEVTVAGQRAFCPFSQVDRQKKDASKLIGRKFDFLVTEYSLDDRGLNVVLSRRALQELEAEAMKEAMLEELTEGETLNGVVTRVLEFGAFVDLGGIEGLVPAREIAWDRVDDPNTVLKAGDPITVKILRINRDEGKLTLSRKECIARVFRKSPEEAAAEKSAAEVSAWMDENSKRNATFGSGAFDQL